MLIRSAHTQDLRRIMDIYDTARSFMRSSGNLAQWVNGYPQRELIEEDIACGNHYVCVEGERIVAGFTLIHGEDPTYQTIEGQWLDSQPYATLHRIGSDGSCHGILHHVLLWASTQCPNLRTDTHADNTPMLHLLKKEGFTFCGIIHVADGSPRHAFQRQTPRPIHG